MEDFNPFLDALIEPDFTSLEHLDIPVDEMVEKYGTMLNSRHIPIWKDVWKHNLAILRLEIGKQPADYFRQEIELQFMRMFRSMAILQNKAVPGQQYFAYAGPLDDKTRPFCVTRVGNVYTPGQILSWNRFEWDGKITAEYGASPEDIFINLGGFGCRHYLTQ